NNRVDLRFGCSIYEIENSQTGVTATLTDASSVRADLLVGADGIHWTVRQRVFGREVDFPRYLGFHAAAYVSSTHTRCNSGRRGVTQVLLYRHMRRKDHVPASATIGAATRPALCVRTLQ